MAGGPQQGSLEESTLSGVCICSRLPPLLSPSASCPHCLYLPLSVSFLQVPGSLRWLLVQSPEAFELLLQ